MLATLWVWVGLSILGVVWFSIALSVVAAVVVGGRAEKRAREVERSERTGRKSGTPAGSLAEGDSRVIAQAAGGSYPAGSGAPPTFPTSEPPAPLQSSAPQ